MANNTILQRIASGDQLAIDECLDRYGSLVWSLAKRWLGNNVDAEDATQEIFVELWQRANKFDPALAGEATFVSMIARRRLIDRTRKESRRPQTEEMVVEPIDHVSAQTTELADWTDDIAKVKRCLSRLSATQQEILTLAVYHGTSHSIISGRLAIPLGTVKSYARRGLIQLRDCMKLHSESSSHETLPSSLHTLDGTGSR